MLRHLKNRQMSGNLKPAVITDKPYQPPVVSPPSAWHQEFDDIFDVEPLQDSAEQSAAKNRRKLRNFRLEITLSLPPTAEYERHSGMWKSVKLKTMFAELVNHWTFNPQVVVSRHARYIEKGEKNGRIHLHGFIDIETHHQHSPKGAVEETARLNLRNYSKWKTHSKYEEHLFYDYYQRYVTQNICIQYISYEDAPERMTEWEHYITKKLKEE